LPTSLQVEREHRFAKFSELGKSQFSQLIKFSKSLIFCKLACYFSNKELLQEQYSNLTVQQFCPTTYLLSDAPFLKGLTSSKSKLKSKKIQPCQHINYF